MSVQVTISAFEVGVSVATQVVTVTLSQYGSQGAAGVGVPSGGTSGQVLTKNSSTPYDTSWQTNTAGSAVWGSITGTLSNQTDLQTQLNSLLAISVALS